MEIQQIGNTYIVTPLTPKIDLRECERLFEEIKKLKNSKIGLNLNFVSDCSYEFLDELIRYSKHNRIGLFNISSEIFVLFNIMNVDEYAELFSGELDFLDTAHRLINRKFALV